MLHGLRDSDLGRTAKHNSLIRCRSLNMSLVREQQWSELQTWKSLSVKSLVAIKYEYPYKKEVFANKALIHQHLHPEHTFRCSNFPRDLPIVVIWNPGDNLKAAYPRKTGCTTQFPLTPLSYAQTKSILANIQIRRVLNLRRALVNQ